MIFLSTLFIFSISVFLGFIPPIVWGIIGGDEPLIKKYPKWTGFLHMIHHWQIGVAIVICSLFAPPPYNTVITGWGFGTAIDDILFHSFEKYFKRKGCNGKCSGGDQTKP